MKKTKKEKICQVCGQKIKGRSYILHFVLGGEGETCKGRVCEGCYLNAKERGFLDF